MKPKHGADNFCPCCGRHCPAEKLSCPKGQAYFGQQAAADHHSGHDMPEIKDETVLLMLQCGHYLHHGLHKSPDELLSFLSEEEKSELTALLKKCIDEWNK